MQENNHDPQLRQQCCCFCVIMDGILVRSPNSLLNVLHNNMQWNLHIMKELGQPICFIERYKPIEEHAN